MARLLIFITIFISTFTFANTIEQGVNMPIKRLNPKGTVDTQAFGYTSVIETSGEGRYIFVSGVFSIDENGKIIGNTFAEHIEQSFSNVRKILISLGASPKNVVKTTTLIVDHKEEYLPILHEQMAALFGDNPPTSTVIPVPRLALDAMLFEIELVIFIPNDDRS